MRWLLLILSAWLISCQTPKVREDKSPIDLADWPPGKNQKPYLRPTVRISHQRGVHFTGEKLPYELERRILESLINKPKPKDSLEEKE